MLEYRIFKYRDASIILIETDEEVDELKMKVPDLEYYKAEMNDIRNEKRMKEFLAVRCGVGILLGNEVKITYDKAGRPLLMHSNQQISISHSQCYVALIAHPFLRTGIDIEVPSAKIARVAKRFLSEKERSYLNDDKKMAIGWSAKEALYKIIGEDATDFGEVLEIEPFEVSEKGTIVAKFLPEDKAFLLEYQCTDLYTLVYTLDNNNISA